MNFIDAVKQVLTLGLWKAKKRTSRRNRDLDHKFFEAVRQQGRNPVLAKSEPTTPE